MKHVLAALLALSFSISTGSAFAAGRSISGTHGKDEIKETCGENGGSFWSNLDGYGCDKSNCDGKQGLCQVSCDAEGNCIGTTPGRRLPGKNRGLGPKAVLEFSK